MIQNVRKFSSFLNSLQINKYMEAMNNFSTIASVQCHTILCVYSPSKNGQKRSLWVAKSLAKVRQLLLHEEAGGPDGKVDPYHRAVCSVGSTKGIVDVDITKLGEGCSERLHCLGAGLDLLPSAVHSLTLLLNVETEILKENNTSCEAEHECGRCVHVHVMCTCIQVLIYYYGLRCAYCARVLTGNWFA